jgi:polyisoprenoid-binding protein YceI
LNPLGGNEYNVTGDLTMHGVTKPVTLKAEYGGQGKTPLKDKLTNYAV